MIQEFVWACPLCGAEPDRASLNCVCCGEKLTLQKLDLLTGQPSVVQPDREYNYEVQVRCEACKGAFPAYLCQAETFEMLKVLRETIMEDSEGRNKDCWPLCSFDGKDADLEPSGCTGIRRIVGVNQDKVLFEVGGHKTVVDSDCLPHSPSHDGLTESHREEFDERARDYVCHSGFAAEHDGDGAWVISFSDVIAVAFDETPDATAAKVYAEAKTRTDAFQKEMAGLDRIMNHLFATGCANIMADVAVATGPNDLEALQADLQDVYGDGDPGTKVLMESILQAARSDKDFTAETWKGVVNRKRHKYAELMGDFDFMDSTTED